MRKALVGTFHKTGTVLMANILRQVSGRLGYRLWPMHDRSAPAPAAWDIGWHNHSRFPGDVLRSVPHRGVLIIRDPRDIVISAAHYHGRAQEKWLHRPRPQFAGRTYQQAITALPTMRERFLFEMEHSSRRNIHEILEAVDRHPEFLVVRFEDLVTDVGLGHFRGIFTHLGFPPCHVEEILRIAEGNSLFSGQVRKGIHVRSGKPAQWKTEFTPDLLRAFADAFGDAPERLGYEGTPAELLAASAGEGTAPS